MALRFLSSLFSLLYLVNWYELVLRMRHNDVKFPIKWPLKNFTQEFRTWWRWIEGSLDCFIEESGDTLSGLCWTFYILCCLHFFRQFIALWGCNRFLTNLSWKCYLYISILFWQQNLPSLSVIVLSSLQSTFVPTNMNGVLGQWCLISGSHVFLKCKKFKVVCILVVTLD